MATRLPTPVGEKFNRLTILSDAPKRPGNSDRRGTARCDCGVVKDYVLTEMRLGKTKSCGCIKKDMAASLTHGHTKGRKFSPEYYSWACMMTRCHNGNSTHFKHYGGRGITVCPRWKSFENFLADMDQRPEGTSLDRVDPNGNYDPGNCRWATSVQQGRNTRHVTLVEYKGEKKPISAWAEQFGLTYNTLLARIHRLRWPTEKALTTPPGPSYERKPKPASAGFFTPIEIIHHEG